MKKNSLDQRYTLLMTSYSLSLFSEGILLPIYAIFVQQIGGDVLDAAGAMAIFLVAQGLFTIVIHRLRWTQHHRSACLILGWLIRTFGIGLYLIVSSTRMLFVTQIFIALGNAIADPIFDAELADHTYRKNASFQRGIFEGMHDIVSGIAALIGGLIATFWGFHTLIIVMIIFATGSLVGILRYVWRRGKAGR